MKNAMWQYVGQRLEELCVDDLPASVGIGAMRFASGGSNRVSNWHIVLGKLVEVAKHQGMDVATAFRGLIEDHGAEQGPSEKVSNKRSRHSHK
jgi:hypothetical protein